MSNQKPLRGEVWLVDFNPTVGYEQAKTRPCLIISNDIFNRSQAHFTYRASYHFKREKQPFACSSTGT